VKHVPNSGIAQLAGNSVHADKRFLEKEMPKVVEHLHYRIVGKWAWQLEFLFSVKIIPPLGLTTPLYLNRCEYSQGAGSEMVSGHVQCLG
jgi:hypothetical protein